MARGADRPPLVSRRAVLAFRLERQQLVGAGPAERRIDDLAVLDYGMQDTGPDGAGWALAIRGVGRPGDRTVLAWTIRGAPHCYRRRDLAAVADATSPFSEADAAMRIFDAARPLKAAGIPIVDALRQVAEAMRGIVSQPTTKGELSTRLTTAMAEPFLRSCRPCNATHLYEQPFRLAALQAGLVLEPGTSPPVLQRAPRLKPALYGHHGGEAKARFDVVRNHLRFYGPTSIAAAAKYIDAPQRDIEAHWPDDAVEVAVAGVPGKGARTRQFVLRDDLDDLLAAEGLDVAGARLLGPFDPYLQLRDRELLVPGADHRKDLWRTLGRPGGVLVDGEVRASWRPRASGKKLTVAVTPWGRLSAPAKRAVEAEAARLAGHRDVALAGVEWA
jgi:hypothetical protein